MNRRLLVELDSEFRKKHEIMSRAGIPTEDIKELFINEIAEFVIKLK